MKQLDFIVFVAVWTCRVTDFSLKVSNVCEREAGTWVYSCKIENKVFYYVCMYSLKSFLFMNNKFFQIPISYSFFHSEVSQTQKTHAAEHSNVSYLMWSLSTKTTQMDQKTEATNSEIHLFFPFLNVCYLILPFTDSLILFSEWFCPLSLFRSGWSCWRTCLSWPGSSVLLRHWALWQLDSPASSLCSSSSPSSSSAPFFF